MKNYKKILAVLLGMAMTVSLFAGCGNSGQKSEEQTPPQTKDEPAQNTPAESAEPEEEETKETETTEASASFSGTLKLYGPGLFTDV